MKRMILLSAIILMTAPLPLPSQEPESPGPIRISSAVIARSVEDREPQGEGTRFPADIGQLVCHTRVEGAQGEAAIYHVWRHGDTLHAKVQLSVRSASWRTWSRKRIHPSWTGPWSVDIEDAEGNVLQSLSFTIGDEGSGSGDEGAGDPGGV